MVNHPNRSRKSATVNQLKTLLGELSDSEVLELAAGRIAVAVFPMAGKKVQADAYFAQDVPDGAAEEYWAEFGPRATLILDAFDEGLYELPLEWQEELKFALEGTSLAAHWETIHGLLSLGRAAKAGELRRRVLASNLVAAVENALTEVNDNEATG